MEPAMEENKRQLEGTINNQNQDTRAITNQYQKLTDTPTFISVRDGERVPKSRLYRATTEMQWKPHRVTEVGRQYCRAHIGRGGGGG